MVLVVEYTSLYIAFFKELDIIGERLAIQEMYWREEHVVEKPRRKV